MFGISYIWKGRPDFQVVVEMYTISSQGQWLPILWYDEPDSVTGLTRTLQKRRPPHVLALVQISFLLKLCASLDWSCLKHVYVIRYSTCNQSEGFLSWLQRKFSGEEIYCVWRGFHKWVIWWICRPGIRGSRGPQLSKMKFSVKEEETRVNQQWKR